MPQGVTLDAICFGISPLTGIGSLGLKSATACFIFEAQYQTQKKIQYGVERGHDQLYSTSGSFLSSKMKSRRYTGWST